MLIATQVMQTVSSDAGASRSPGGKHESTRGTGWRMPGTPRASPGSSDRLGNFDIIRLRRTINSNRAGIRPPPLEGVKKSIVAKQNRRRRTRCGSMEARTEAPRLPPLNNKAVWVVLHPQSNHDNAAMRDARPADYFLTAGHNNRGFFAAVRPHRGWRIAAAHLLTTHRLEKVRAAAADAGCRLYR